MTGDEKLLSREFLTRLLNKMQMGLTSVEAVLLHDHIEVITEQLQEMSKVVVFAERWRDGREWILIAEQWDLWESYVRKARTIQERK